MFATKGAECASTVLTWASTPAAAGPRQMSQLRSKAQNMAPARTLLGSNVVYFPLENWGCCLLPSPPPRSYWLWWGAKLPSRRGGTWMSRFLTVGFTLTGGAVRSGGLQLPSLSSTKLRSSFLHLEPTFHLLAFSLLWFILGLSWERCRDGNILSRKRGGIGDGGDTDSRVGRPCYIHLELSSSFSLPFVSLFSFFLPPCFPKPCSTNGNLARY